MAEFGLTEEQIAEFKEAFSIFDKNKDGQLDKQDLDASLRALGMEPTKSEIGLMIDEIDRNKSGSVDFAEFITVVAQKLKSVDKQENIINAFAAFDEKDTKYIPLEDLKEVLTNYGDKLTEREFEKMIKEVDCENGFPYVQFVKTMFGL